ncbi:MAG: response regulator transcription factor [Saprospiraceae bacterium]|nr:response regulator transcription factor [Saprospiraceae bacterium]
MIHCIAVDDEPLALDLLADNISNVPYLKLVQKCRNAFEALAILETADIHLIFLDIQMPRLSGLQLLHALHNKKPMVILVTAYEQYALEGFNLNVTDYLMKPVAFDRFYQACQKAKELFDLRNKENLSANIDESAQIRSQNAQNTEGVSGIAVPHFFFVNVEYSLQKILSDDILYIEGMKDYLKIHLASQSKPIITRLSFKAIEEKLPPHLFFRVHKSYMVNTYKIQNIRNGMIYINKHEIPLSDAMREDLIRKLNIN